MIDVVIPCNPSNASQVALNTISELADSTTIPLRFIVAARGGSKEDWKLMRDGLDVLRDKDGLHYGLMARERIMGTEAQAVFDVLSPGANLLKHEYVMIIRPEVCIRDSQWFDKMVGPIQKAPYVGGVFLPSEFSGSSTLVPHTLNEATKLYGTRGVLTTKTHIEMVGNKAPSQSVKHYDTFLQAALVQAGAVRWMHCGVNFKVLHGATWN